MERLSVTNILYNIFNSSLEFGIFVHIFLNLFDGIDDGGMVTVAEFLADEVHREVCNFPDGINSDLTGIGDIGISLGRADILTRHTEGAGNFINDFFNCQRWGLVIVENVGDGFLSDIDGNFFAVELALGFEDWLCIRLRHQADSFQEVLLCV